MNSLLFYLYYLYFLTNKEIAIENKRTVSANFAQFRGIGPGNIFPIVVILIKIATTRQIKAATISILGRLFISSSSFLNIE